MLFKIELIKLKSHLRLKKKAYITVKQLFGYKFKWSYFYLSSHPFTTE